MKAIFSALIMSLLFCYTASAANDCALKINPEYKNSLYLEVDSDQIDYKDYGKDKLATSYQILKKYLFKEKNCHPKDINFGKGPYGATHSRCRRVVNTRAQSVVCYIESNIGYFIMTRDSQDSVNIIFNIWD